jgi:hypothetical protein
MATDHADQHVIVFGGFSDATNGPQLSDETWLWTGQDWRLLPQLFSPSQRDGAVLEPLSGDRVILYGGYSAAGFSTETWIYGRAAPPPPPQYSGK